MEYIILISYLVEELIEDVKEHLENGWKLQGGASCGISESKSNYSYVFTQALSKDIASLNFVLNQELK